MQFKIFSKQEITILAISGLVLFVVFFTNYISKNSIQSGSDLFFKDPVVLLTQEMISSNLPIRLKISSIGVDALIEHVGITTSGAMGIPKGPAQVAWYSQGPRPGEIGTAVIAGHYGWIDSVPAVFDNLHKLRKGDMVSVEDGNGIITNFIVRELRTYGKDEIVPEVFFSNNDKAHLNLITCSGIWDKENNIRSERLVVFTDEE